MHVARAVILLELLLFAPAFSGNADSAASMSSCRPLNWMGHWKNTDLRDTLVREVEREFSFLHPDICVNLQFPQDIMGERSKPLTAKFIVKMIKTGKIDWDVVWMDDYIYAYAAELLVDRNWGKKHLVDFSSVPGFVESQKDFIASDPQFRDQTGGIHVGPYIEGFYNCLFYNKEIADKVGLKIKSQKMTFDDYYGYIKQITDYNAKNHDSISPSYEAWDWVMHKILFQNLYTSEFPTFDYLYRSATTTEKLKALSKTLAALEKLGSLHPLAHGGAHENWWKSFGTVLHKKQVFYVHGTWMYNLWRQIDKERARVMIPVEVPVFQPVSHAVGGYIPAFAVMKNSPHRDDAIALLMSWCEPHVAERWVRYTKSPTGIKGNLQNDALGNDAYERFNQYMSSTYGRAIHHSPNYSYLFSVNNPKAPIVLEKVLRNLIEGRIAADAAYGEIAPLVK